MVSVDGIRARLLHVSRWWLENRRSVRLFDYEDLERKGGKESTKV